MRAASLTSRLFASVAGDAGIDEGQDLRPPGLNRLASVVTSGTSARAHQ
jgi:hypothetical protein